MRNVNARGKIMCAYAVAVWKDDYRRFLVVDHDHIQRAMRSSGAKGDDPSPVWKDHEAPMWSKTAVRRLCDSWSSKAMSLAASAPTEPCSLRLCSLRPARERS